MTDKKPIIAEIPAPTGQAADHEDQQLALEYLAEAWNDAESEGVPSAALAHASLFAALATLVRLYGDEATADLVADLPERIRCGEYNLERSLQ